MANANASLPQLKAGLALLKKEAKAEKTQLEERLKCCEKLTNEEEKWLDNTGNYVDEERLIADLEGAAVFSEAFSKLSKEQKACFHMLVAKASSTHPKAQKKKKSVSLSSSTNSVTYKLAVTKEKAKDPSKEATSSKAAMPGPKQNAATEQKVEVLNWYEKNGENQTATAKHFASIYPDLRIKQPLVSSWVKEKEKIRKEYENSSVHKYKRKRTLQTEHPLVTQMLDIYVMIAMEHNLLLTGEALRQKWMEYTDFLDVPKDERLSLSEG